MTGTSTADIDQMVSAPDYQVRAILLALCDDSAVARRALNHHARLRAADTAPAALKRKAAHDLFVCVQCDEVFTNEDNVGDSCSYHEGDLEVDDDNDVWADHDENCHGEIDTPEMREEVPDGFVWSCCGRLGGANGCIKGKHEAHPSRSNRGGDVPSGSNMRKNAGKRGGIYDDDDDDEDDDDDDDDDEY